MLTTIQAAERLGYDRSHVRRLILSGQLLAQKVGRDWIILETDLEAFAAAHPKGKHATEPRVWRVKDTE